MLCHDVLIKNIKLRKKYVDKNTWYLYSFAVLPEARGKGIGSTLLKAMLNYFDQGNQACYLETLKKENYSVISRMGSAPVSAPIKVLGSCPFQALA